MTIPSVFIYAFFAAVVLALLISNRAKPAHFLFVVGFVLPLMALSTRIGGVNVMWHKFIGPIALGLLVFARYRRWSALKERPFLVFLAYAVVLTVCWMGFEYTYLRRYELAALIGLSKGQTIYKMPIQLVSFTFQLLAFFIIPTRALDYQDIRAAIRGFIAGCLVSLVAGVLMAVTTGTGYIAGDGATVSLGASSWARIGGLSGEPKHFGAFLVILLLFLASRYAHARGPGEARSAGQLVVVFGVGLFLTFSTSSWIGFVAGLAVFFVLKSFTARPSRSRLFVAVAVVAGVLSLQTPAIQQAYEKRVEERLFNEETNRLDEQKENFVWDVYGEKPEYALIGFGLGGMDLEATPFMLYDPRYSAHLNYVRTPTPGTNGMRLFGDIGIAGLLLFFGMVWLLARRLHNVGEYGHAQFAVAGAIALMFISMNALPTYMFFCGAGVAVLNLRKRQIQRQQRVKARSRARQRGQ